MVKFDEYLNRMGITTDILKDRVKLAYSVASQMCPEEIEEVFVSDYIEDDGTREYESVWFFSKGYCIEAHNFITENSIDIVRIKTKHLVVELKDYDFKKATEKSRLRVLILLGEAIQGEIKAAKENCDVLRDITIKYFKPRLAE